MGWFGCYLQKAPGAWKPDLECFLIPGLRTSSLSPFYRCGRQGPRLHSDSQKLRTWDSCSQLECFPLPHPAQDFVNEASKPRGGRSHLLTSREVWGGGASCGGHEEPTGLEPAGKLDFCSEICRMGVRRKQRVLALPESLPGCLY